MASERLSMRKIREILRQKWTLGRSHREVATSLGVSGGIVAKTVLRATTAKLTRESVVALAHLQEMIQCLGRYCQTNLEVQLPAAIGNDQKPYGRS